MDSSGSLIHIDGELAKPVTTLIKKISKATGELYRPIGTVRMAKAEAKAIAIKAQAEIEAEDLHRRTAHRLIHEATQHQKNRDGITAKAVKEVKETAKPDSMDNDWIVNFFDKGQLVSDEQMQNLWARVLAGEANNPGFYSKRTVNSLSDLEKPEAELFTRLCGFNFQFPQGDLIPIVLDDQADIYSRSGIGFGTLGHLNSIGLVQFGIGHFFRQNLPSSITVYYYGKELNLTPNQKNAIDTGRVRLTLIGHQLSSICESQPVDGFLNYVLEQWKAYSPVLKH